MLNSPVPFDFSPYAAVLLDLDGTLYHEDHALPGAVELVQLLQQLGRPYACLTNSTSSPERIRGRLIQMGIDIPADHIYSAASAAADYALAHFPYDAAGKPRRPRLMNLATEGLGELLEGQVEWVNDPGQACDGVIIGAPANIFATPDRQRVALELARRGAMLIGICADRVYPSPRGMELGCGALTAMLAYGAASSKIVFTGKPEPIFFEELCGHLEVAPAECVLIGDNLESDITGARAVGMATVLVLTGVATAEDLKKLGTDAQPGTVIGNLTQLL